MFFKIIFFSLILINLGLPLNYFVDIFFILICISLFIFTSDIKFRDIKKKYLIGILIITSINFLIPKFLFEELHQVFLNHNDINVIAKILPENTINDIKNDFENKFDFNRLEKSHDWSSNQIKNNRFINNPLAYSVDSFLQNNKFSRINNKLNFSSREDLRIGQINSLTYNLPYDKNLRRSLPYIVLFELNNNFKNSKICFEGNIYIAESKKNLKINQIRDLNFIKQKYNDCLHLNFENNFTYILSYSINEKDTLKIKTNYNSKIIFLKLIKYLFTSLVLILFLLISFKKRNILNGIIYLISSFSTIILTLIRDSDLLFGLRFFRGGADGLLHYSHGRDILKNLNDLNFYNAFRGGEDIFYFMPGLRYFSSVNNLLFGETSYGYLILCTLIPFIIFKIFQKLINNKAAIILFISFIFLPIFENMGFGFFNYVWQFARHHAESLSILLFLYALYLVICLEKKSDKSEPIFLIGILLSLCVFLRPNFFPSSLIIFICSLIIIIQQKNYKMIFLNLIGYSFIFLCLFHNFYFGNSLIFFTQATVNFKLGIFSFFDAILSILKFDFNNRNLIVLQSQLWLWNPIYNIHRLFILMFITFMIFYKKQSILIYGLFISMISQHGLLLLSHPSSRYAYLAWLITFILFANFFTKIKFKKVL